MDLYPVNLKIEGCTCVIVGGGEVALRKTGELVACGGRVIVISPEVVSALSNLIELGKVEWRARTYKKGDLAGAYLVFAATDNRKVQQAVAEEAQERNILFNSVNDPGACTFQVPARVRRGNFLLTVSTGGGSPALAAKLRRELAEEYGEEYQQLVELLALIRKQVVADGRSSSAHKILFEKLLQLNILTQIRRQDWSALEEELRTILPEDMDAGELIGSLRFLDRQGDSQK